MVISSLVLPKFDPKNHTPVSNCSLYDLLRNRLVEQVCTLFQLCIFYFCKEITFNVSNCEVKCFENLFRADTTRSRTGSIFLPYHALVAVICQFREFLEIVPEIHNFRIYFINTELRRKTETKNP